MVERALDVLYGKCDRLLRKGFEVGLEFTVEYSDTGKVSPYTSWFISSDDLIWWDTIEPEYRPVKFSFNSRRPYRNDVWMAHASHDPVKWVLDALLEDVEDGNVILADDPTVFARVLDTDIIMADPPPGCSADAVQTFMNFKARHSEVHRYVCPSLRTLQDIALSRLDPLLLGDVIRSDILDAAHAVKWKPVAFPAFRV